MALADTFPGVNMALLSPPVAAFAGSLYGFMSVYNIPAVPQNRPTEPGAHTGKLPFIGYVPPGVLPTRVGTTWHGGSLLRRAENLAMAAHQYDLSAERADSSWWEERCDKAAAKGHLYSAMCYLRANRDVHGNESIHELDRLAASLGKLGLHGSEAQVLGSIADHLRSVDYPRAVDYHRRASKAWGKHSMTFQYAYSDSEIGLEVRQRFLTQHGFDPDEDTFVWAGHWAFDAARGEEGAERIAAFGRIADILQGVAQTMCQKHTFQRRVDPEKTALRFAAHEKAAENSLRFAWFALGFEGNLDFLALSSFGHVWEASQLFSHAGSSHQADVRDLEILLGRQAGFSPGRSG